MEQSKGECIRKKLNFCPKANKDDSHSYTQKYICRADNSHATWTFMKCILLGVVAEFMVLDI